MSGRKSTKFSIVPPRVADDSPLVGAIRPLAAASSLDLRMAMSVDPFKWADMMAEVSIIVDRYARITAMSTPRVRRIK